MHMDYTSLTMLVEVQFTGTEQTDTLKTATSQVTPEVYREAFTEALKDCSKILYLSFTSGMSGSCGNAILTAREMMEENPDIEIITVRGLGYKAIAKKS